MKTIAIQMKNYAGSINIVDNNNLQGRILHTMLFGLVLLAGLYVFLLGNIVFNIVERRTYEAEARVLSTQVGDLQLNYLSMTNKVDLALSYSLGFKETKPTFAIRKSLSSLSPLGSLPAKSSLGSISYAKNDL